MLSHLQEVGARFGVVVTPSDVGVGIPELWPRIAEQRAELDLHKKEVFRLRSVLNTISEELAQENGRLTCELAELRKEKAALQQRLSTYEPGEVQS